MESVLELPRSMNYFVRVPSQKHLPRGPLATTWLDEDLLRLGLVTADQIVMQEEDPEEDRHRMFAEERPCVLHLADKLRLRFDYDFPGVHDLRTAPVWVAGELLEFGGDFDKYVTSKALQKQEGVIFRHLLRLILLVGEFLQFCPPETNDDRLAGRSLRGLLCPHRKLPQGRPAKHGKGAGRRGDGEDGRIGRMRQKHE